MATKMLLFTVVTLAVHCDVIFGHTYQEISHTKPFPPCLSVHKIGCVEVMQAEFHIVPSPSLHSISSGPIFLSMEVSYICFRSSRAGKYVISTRHFELPLCSGNL